MMRFALPLLCAVLLCAAPARAVNFYDDFESGNMSNWTQYPGSDAALAISTDHNKVPAGGQYSAKQDALVASGAGIASYHYFGQTSGYLAAETWIFDDFNNTEDPVQGAITLQTDDGSGMPNFGDYLRLGMLGFNSNTNYSFRTASGGFTDTGVARKSGWTKLGIQVDDPGAGGQARFYIDDAQVGTSSRSGTYFSVITIGQNFNNQQYFYYDGVSVVPEPASVLLLCLGGLGLVGVSSRRRRGA